MRLFGLRSIKRETHVHHKREFRVDPLLDPRPKDDMPEDAVHIGHGHYIDYFGYNKEQYPDAPEKAGIFEYHYRLNHDFTRWIVCTVILNFWCPPDEDEKLWQVKSLDPLTISPSVHCAKINGGCGEHGHIEKGEWHEAFWEQPKWFHIFW